MHPLEQLYLTLDLLTIRIVGQMCGASFINEKYEKKLLKKLARETYLETNGRTIKSIVQAQTSIFENYEKRRIDTTKRQTGSSNVRIVGLRANDQRKFASNTMKMKK
jgi:hypothetical protein